MRPRSWPSERDRIRAEERRRAPGGSNPCMTGRKRKGHQAVPRERFDLGPQRREMDTVVDGERGEAASPGRVVDERPARVESDLRITTLAVDPLHARSGVMETRPRHGITLSRPHRGGA